MDYLYEANKAAREKYGQYSLAVHPFTDGFCYAITNIHLPEIAKLKEENERLKGLCEPYPLSDVLSRLIDASEFLLIHYSYDGHNYEEIECCIRRAKEINQFLKQGE